MKKIFMLLLSCCFFAACSQNEIIESTIDLGDLELRAASNIFKMTEIGVPNSMSRYSGVDNEGNFYWTAHLPDNNDDGRYAIMKYDLSINQTYDFYASSDLTYDMVGYMGFDENNNLCYIIPDEEQWGYIYYLKRITPDGNSVTMQSLKFFDTPTTHDIGGMCVSPNGNIFFSVNSDEPEIYRLSPNNVMKKIDVDFSSVGVFPADLFKASGAIQYFSYYRHWYYNGHGKINVNTGTVELMDLRFFPPQYGISACTGKSNMYAINGNQIVQVRTNASSDLVVGTIPVQYKNSDGEFVDVGTPDELYMNSDATVFYIMTKQNGQDDKVFKLTL